MELFQKMMIVYIVITAACVLFCIIATMRVWFDHIRQKRESRAEIEHLKAEVRACWNLLRKKVNKDE